MICQPGCQKPSVATDVEHAGQIFLSSAPKETSVFGFSAHEAMNCERRSILIGHIMDHTITIGSDLQLVAWGTATVISFVSGSWLLEWRPLPSTIEEAKFPFIFSSLFKCSHNTWEHIGNSLSDHRHMGLGEEWPRARSQQERDFHGSALMRQRTSRKSNLSDGSNCEFLCATQYVIITVISRAGSLDSVIDMKRNIRISSLQVFWEQPY
jgi:hypothetical protein